LPLFLGGGCGQNISSFAPVTILFPSFFPLSSLALEPFPTHFQSSLSICLLLDLVSILFIAIYFILNNL
jgi:hypothetical protein